MATVNGQQRISGDLTHTGSNVGFYGVAPAARPATYTQTYATADKTHANPTATTIANSAGVAGFLTDAERANSTAAINALIVDVADVKQVVNSVIDDLQLLGLLQ